MPKRRHVVRLLVVEDTERRVDYFKSQLPSDWRLVWARSGGAALAIVKRDTPTTYTALMLDHDLDDQSPTNVSTNGQKVVKAIIDQVETDRPVLVHSMNIIGAPKMVEMLEGAGFTVTRIPYADMTDDRLKKWFEQVAETARADAEELEG
jgi:CheY-like chemotaxis protein